MHRYKVPVFNEEEVKVDNVDVLANVGHEIRNSLNAIIGLSHLLNSSISIKEVRNYNEGLMQTSETLMEIGNNLMDFSKLRSGSLKINLKPVELQKCLALQLSGQRMIAEAKGLDFFIGQVVINLVSNAIKFTAAGQIGVVVELQDKTDWKSGCSLLWMMVELGFQKVTWKTFSSHSIRGTEIPISILGNWFGIFHLHEPCRAAGRPSCGGE